MQSLKESGRHGPAVGVEMTMSLSGPPGLHRHTTVHTDSLYHYMNRQQQQPDLQHKLMPAVDLKGAVGTRGPGGDHRLSGGHDGVQAGREHRMVGADVRQPSMDLKGANLMRGVHDTRPVDMLGSKDAGRIISDHHSQSSQQQSHHSKKYSDLRGSTPHETSVADGSNSRDTVLHGKPLGPSRPASSHVLQQSQLPLPDPRMTSLAAPGGTYHYDAHATQMSAAPINPMMSPSVLHRKSGSVQLSPSGQSPGMVTSLAYSVQKSVPSRSADMFTGSGLHGQHGHEAVQTYMSVKQADVYDEYNKAIAAGHFVSEMAKAGQSHDALQIGQHSIIPQHRDLIRDPQTDVNDPRYNQNSRNIPKQGLEITGHMKLHNDSAHATVTNRVTVEDQLSKSSSFISPLPSPFSKDQQPKSMMFSSGPEVVPRSGHDPYTTITHLQPAPNLQTVQHVSFPTTQRHSDSVNSYLEAERRTPTHKSVGVIRPPPHHDDDAVWREGYHTSTKQTPPAFHSDDRIAYGSKNCVIIQHDGEACHPALHNAGPNRMQRPVSTNRTIYDANTTQGVPYSDQLSQAERYLISQKEHISNRPSSVGRNSQFQQNLPVGQYDDRPPLNEQADKLIVGTNNSGVGTSALDLTKLNAGNAKMADSPLDLTVKTKKRRVDDRETPEYDRILSAAKRQKIEADYNRPGLPGQKSVIGMPEGSQNPIWLQSPAARGLDGYDHRSDASSAYPSQSSLARPLKYSQGRVTDERSNADGQIGRDRQESRTSRGVSIDTRAGVDIHPLSMAAGAQGKVVGPSIVPEMVRHAVVTNPPMVPLTTQLQKVKEEQAYQMKLQRMNSDAVLPGHSDSKQLYKESASPRHMEPVAGSPNEVVVVRHSQHNYSIPSQQQQSSQHPYIKQQPMLDVQQSHHHQKMLASTQEIIELGVKDSSDPLQASRSSHFSLRAYPTQMSLAQQHHPQHKQQQQQQMCVIQQQQQFSPKEQPQLSPYSHPQQLLFTKDQQHHQQHQQQQQAYSKDQFHFMSQQQYQRSQYPTKRSEDMGRPYHKETQLQTLQLQRKRAEVDDYKQIISSAQSALSATQKWNIAHQQRPALKAGYTHCQPNSGVIGDNRVPKMASVYSKSSSHPKPPVGREYDTYNRYGSNRTDRLKPVDCQKSLLPQVAGPLPAGGVREESRRALSRRVSSSGATSGVVMADPSKQTENIRKKSTPSLSEKVEVTGDIESGRVKYSSSISAGSKKSETAFEDFTVKGSDTNGDNSSQIIPAQHIGSFLKTDEESVELTATTQTAAQFAVPLSLTIPQTANNNSPSSCAQSPASRPAPSHKAWSRKHMILSAVSQDESLKRIISNSGSKHEAGGLAPDSRNRIIANSTCSPIPTSPKMPVLSPQDDEGEPTSEDQGVRVQTNDDDPPTLNPSIMEQTKSTASRAMPHPQLVLGSSVAPAVQKQQTCTSLVPTDNNPLTKEIYKSHTQDIDKNMMASDEIPGKTIVVRRCTIADSLTEQQVHHHQQQHDDSQKTTAPGNVPYKTAEVIRRNSLAGHALGPWGHMKNIPIANVAPFVHSRDDDDKSKQQKLEENQQSQQMAVHFPSTGSTFMLSGETQDPPKDSVLSKSGSLKHDDFIVDTDGDKIIDTRSLDKEDASLSASSSSKTDISTKRKKLTKLRVSSPTKMKELELISPSLEYAVLKSTGLDDLKALDKLSQAGVRKSMSNRLKYKHTIIREKNKIVKQKKTVKKRIQYVFDDDEDEEVDESISIYDDDDDDEDFELDGGNKGSKNIAKVDSESKVKDREKRALRREQLRDQSEESTTRQPATSSSNSQSQKSSEKNSSGNKQRTRSKESFSSGKHKHSSAKHTKPASRISRRRLSNTNQRAQELKHIALVQRRKTGKRKIRRYNRNAAYEQELHREANRRAVVRAKRQASSKARERLQQQRDFSQDGDNDDNPLDETWKLPETRPTSGSGKKNQNILPKQGSNRGNNKSVSHASQTGKSSSSTSGGQQRKEDYESDVENVPDDLATEMVSDEVGNQSSRKKKTRPAKARGRREDGDQTGNDSQDIYGAEEGPSYFEDEGNSVLTSIPIENVPVPADLKKLTINKNSGETLLHRAARIGHEEITLYCLKTQTVYVNARDNAGYTPLHESCVRGSVTVARHLIYHGADVNCCSQDGIRPIHDAIENEHVQVVRLLLVHGADPLIATYAGRTPLRIARSLLMLQTLQGYISDLNGWPQLDDDDDDDDHDEDEVVPWRFTSSLTFLESSQAEGYSPCVDLPPDPADDSSDVFDDGPTSAINVFNLALDGEDRTPQPFCLLDEVINRLNMSEDKLSSLFPWKPTSVTLSSERVREVASCCCSNVSIRLPQSGKVTLLPFLTLNKIEKALKQQMKVKVKKEEEKFFGKEIVKKMSSSSCVPILTRLEQPNSFLDDGFDKETSCPSKLKSKSQVFPATLASTSISSLVLSPNNSGGLKSSSKSLSSTWAPSTEQQSFKKVSLGHRQHQEQQSLQSQPLQHQRLPPSTLTDALSLPTKPPPSAKEGRSMTSASFTPRKSKKEDVDNPWINTPMFSDESSSSPFHTSLDCFDSDNSI